VITKTAAAVFLAAALIGITGCSAEHNAEAPVTQETATETPSPEADPVTVAPVPEETAAELPDPAPDEFAETTIPEPVQTVPESPGPFPTRLEGSGLAMSDIEGEVRFVDYLVERDWDCMGGEMEPAIFGIQSKDIPPGRFLEDGEYRLYDGTVIEPYWEYVDGALWLGLDGDDPIQVIVPEIITVPSTVDVWIDHPGAELYAYTTITFENAQMHVMVAEYSDPDVEQPEFLGSEITCMG
jgi:hypothetical protein